MIRRVRRQFILITMSMLTAVLLVPLVALNVVTQAISYRQTKTLLEQIAISEIELSQDHSDFPGSPPYAEDESSQAEIVTDSVVQTTTDVVVTTSPVSAGNTDPPRNNNSITGHGTEPQQAPTKSTTTAVVSRETMPPATTTPAIKATQQPKTTATASPPLKPHPITPQYPDLPAEANPVPQSDSYDLTLAVSLGQSVGTAAPRSAAAGMTSALQEEKQEPPIRDRKGESVTIDHFLCVADPQGILTRMSGTEDYSEAEGQALITLVLSSPNDDGTYENLQYFRKELADGGALVVFSDRSSDQLLMHKLLWVSILMFILMEGMILCLTMLLTKRAMRPMQATFERQRQFISDAGHELKTPLTIISANVDVLYDEIGQNKWLGYIRSQTERMRVLIGDMMNLTKLDFGDPKKDFTTFSLSSLVSNTALPFEGQAYEQQKTLILEIQEDLHYTGNAEQIQQLVGIFIDNAIKYSDEHGEIRVILHQMRDKCILKVFNTGKGVMEREREKIFERFYRSDSSRARTTGGYGLGLSIAKSIADTHKIKIQVESEYGKWITFVLTL